MLVCCPWSPLSGWLNAHRGNKTLAGDVTASPLLACLPPRDRSRQFVGPRRPAGQKVRSPLRVLSRLCAPEFLRLSSQHTSTCSRFVLRFAGSSKSDSFLVISGPFAVVVRLFFVCVCVPFSPQRALFRRFEASSDPLTHLMFCGLLSGCHHISSAFDCSRVVRIP